MKRCGKLDVDRYCDFHMRDGQICLDSAYDEIESLSSAALGRELKMHETLVMAEKAVSQRDAALAELERLRRLEAAALAISSDPEGEGPTNAAWDAFNDAIAEARAAAKEGDRG